LPHDSIRNEIFHKTQGGILINYKISISKRMSNSFKQGISRIVLFFLYRAFQVLYRYDKNIRREVDGWKPGLVICMKTARKGPAICLIHTDKGVGRLKKYEPSDVDMNTEFRNIDAAFLVLSGQIGVAQSYAQHGFSMHGSIYDCMSFLPCVEIIEAYLFPKFIAKRILKSIPKKEISPVSVYWHAILGF
jgi:hypothetical protein